MQVSAALETEGEDALDVSLVAFGAGLSMEWVSDLCCTSLFYHRCAASYCICLVPHCGAPSTTLEGLCVRHTQRSLSMTLNTAVGCYHCVC